MIFKKQKELPEMLVTEFYKKWYSWKGLAVGNKNPTELAVRINIAGVAIQILVTNGKTSITAALYQSPTNQLHIRKNIKVVE